MAKQRSDSRSSKRPSQSRRRKTTRYTAGEWFMVLVGALFVIFFAGIIITSILGE